MKFEEAIEILSALSTEGVEYVLVGSMAMAALGVPRATQDMDIFVAPTEENIERLKRALRGLFHDPSIDEIDASELVGDYPALQYIPPHGRFSLDVLTRLGEAFRWEDLESAEVEAGPIRIRVATARMLYRMKKDTVRPQDRADAFRIREVFGIRED